MHMKNEHHLFRDCAVSAQVWACSSLGMKVCSNPSTPIGERIQNFLKLFCEEDSGMSERTKDFIATLSAIWLHRNNVVFRNSDENPVSIQSCKEALLKDYIEGTKLTESHIIPSHLGTNNRIEVYLTSSPCQWEICKIPVYGAWKRYKQQLPRAGIGWSAFINDIQAFAGILWPSRLFKQKPTRCIKDWVKHSTRVSEESKFIPIAQSLFVQLKVNNSLTLKFYVVSLTIAKYYT